MLMSEPREANSAKKPGGKETEGVAHLGPVSPCEQEEAAKFWTKERRREAAPLPLPNPAEQPQDDKAPPRRQDD
jgi:hypothetical protein